MSTTLKRRIIKRRNTTGLKKKNHQNNLPPNKAIVLLRRNNERTFEIVLLSSKHAQDDCKSMRAFSSDVSVETTAKTLPRQTVSFHCPRRAAVISLHPHFRISAPLVLCYLFLCYFVCSGAPHCESLFRITCQAFCAFFCCVSFGLPVCFLHSDLR